MSKPKNLPNPKSAANLKSWLDYISIYGAELITGMDEVDNLLSDTHFLDQHNQLPASLYNDNKVVFDALLTVGMIGNGDIKVGTELLRKQYSKIFNSKNRSGWGVKKQGKPGVPLGKQLATVAIIKKYKKKNINGCTNLEDASHDLNVEYDTFKNYQRGIRKRGFNSEVQFHKSCGFQLSISKKYRMRRFVV